MITEAIKEVVEKLDSEIREHDLGDPFFSRKEYQTSPLNKDNFISIKEADDEINISYIDGGNKEILGAPNFSIQVNRVYFNIFKGQKRVRAKKLPSRIEFFSATFSSFRKGEIYYDTSIFPVRKEFGKFLPDGVDLSFSSLDRNVAVGNFMADIQRVSSIARRFAEWEYAKHVVASELKKGDVIVIDGTLQTAFTNESKYSEGAYKAAKDNGVIFTGLSKTSHLFTDTGLSLIGAIHKLAVDSKIPHNKWCYPVAEIATQDHEATIFVAKLHPNAERIFRYEINKGQSDEIGKAGINNIMSNLAVNSRDISFPGYPYGLIDADLRARVREDEVEGYRVKILSEISKKKGRWVKFARHMMATDAHDLLNIIAG